MNVAAEMFGKIPLELFIGTKKQLSFEKGVLKNIKNSQKDNCA